MSNTIIDLSLPIKNGTNEPESPRITYFDHTRGAKNLINGAANMLIKRNLLVGLLFKLFVLLRTAGARKILNYKIPAITHKDFPGEMGLANEELLLDSHAGTHLDAPWHFGPALTGMKTKTVDKLPLDWCYSDGLVLDLRHKKASEVISEEDIISALKRINYKIKPFDIVLIMTGADKCFENKDYFSAHPGMSAEATQHLVEQGVKIIGIDGWGFDRPAMKMLEDFLKTGDSSVIFPAHLAGRKFEYCHIEKLANLDKIPRPYGFKVACFPIKIENASAGWCRTVAIL
jgi:kynurenine formamidase